MVGYKPGEVVPICDTPPKSIEELFGIRRDKHQSAAASICEPPEKYALSRRGRIQTNSSDRSADDRPTEGGK